MDSINLIYLSPWSVGGFTSFTSHLARCLEIEGVEVQTLRCNRDRAERNERTMKGHGFRYRNVTIKDAVNATKKLPTLIVAVARPEDLADPSTIQRLLDAGARVCVQSTQEFKQFPHVRELIKSGSESVVVIRKRLAKYFKGSQYLPHPYLRVFDDLSESDFEHRQRACSISMVATNKHPEILCGVNETLPRKCRVKLLGKETTHFLGLALAEKYPHYEKPKGFRCSQEAADLASHYQFAVDLSEYIGDGGGTQYSFMEAMDGGAVPIIHKNWEKEVGDMEDGYNCIAVDSKQELEAVLRGRTKHNLKKLRRGGSETLHMHSGKVIRKYLRNIFG